MPAPFFVERFNFNPHSIIGHFDQINGKYKILKEGTSLLIDKNGRYVNKQGFYIDQFGNIVDNTGAKKFDRSQLKSNGELPKLFNLKGRRFDIHDVIGVFDKDKLGNIIKHKYGT